VTSAEDGAEWLSFFRDLATRRLPGVRLVTSDAHGGLLDAIGATLPGGSWPRRRTDHETNLMKISGDRQHTTPWGLTQRGGGCTRTPVTLKHRSSVWQARS
jgi:putative transposase